VTAADTLLVLWFQRYGIRTTEAIVLALISVIAGCFCIEIFLAKPNVHEMATGLVPRLNATNLYIVIGILGATVMPHNLYLHSALVQTRHIGWSQMAKRIACRYNFIDSLVALNGALLVNAAILVVAGTVFFKRGIVVTEIQQAYMLLTPLLGYSAASIAFAIALLCSGQSSTLTGTLAGQIVMEGFLNFRMRPWLRRLVTRSLAIIPAALTIYFAGDASTYHLLLLSQVILSMQLPFAVIPLIHFTSDRRRMGDFANRLWVTILAWITAAIIVSLNVWLVAQAVAGWLEVAGRYRPFVILLLRARTHHAAGYRGSGRRSSGLPPDPGSARPHGARSTGHRARRRHGADASCKTLSAARRRRRDQPSVWVALLHRRGRSRREVSGRDRGLAAR